MMKHPIKRDTNYRVNAIWSSSQVLNWSGDQFFGNVATDLDRSANQNTSRLYRVAASLGIVL